MAAELPQITNKTELENALSGTKKMYAVLNAPVSGSPVDDVFDILTDEYFYIRYSGENIKLSVYYQDGLGAQDSYTWEQTDDIRESMSPETFLYNDIPIDLTDCAVNDPDTLSSPDQFRLPENTKAFLNLDADYYYPDGEGDDPYDMKENCGLTRYRPFFLKSGTSLTFLAWVGDNEISVYRTEPDDENYVPATVFQHGNLSDLTWAMKSSDVGIVILLWIGVIFIIVVLILTSYHAEEEGTPPPAVKKGNKKKKKRR